VATESNDEDYRRKNNREEIMSSLVIGNIKAAPGTRAFGEIAVDRHPAG
jgi:hypothetical protein